MKKCNDHMTVLVIDSKSEKSYIRRKMAILPAMADAQSMPYIPKRVHLVQRPEGYGFLLRHEKTSTGRQGARQSLKHARTIVIVIIMLQHASCDTAF